MRIVPAVDLRGGLCVNLVQGDYDQETVFSEDPVSQAVQWRDLGAELVHVVDLSSPNAAEQCKSVEDILADLDLMKKPRITALNKIDLLLDREKTWTEQEALDYLAAQPIPASENTVLVSADKKWGLAGLLQQIRQILSKNMDHFNAPEK